LSAQNEKEKANRIKVFFLTHIYPLQKLLHKPFRTHQSNNQSGNYSKRSKAWASPQHKKTIARGEDKRQVKISLPVSKHFE
jgi:hypothetical protein